MTTTELTRRFDSAFALAGVPCRPQRDRYAQEQQGRRAALIAAVVQRMNDTPEMHWVAARMARDAAGASDPEPGFVAEPDAPEPDLSQYNKYSRYNKYNRAEAQPAVGPRLTHAPRLP